MKLAGLYLKNPTMNAPGICSGLDMLKVWEEAGVGAVVAKPFGMRPESGYNNPTCIEPYPGVFLNAMGLPNPGYEEFLKEREDYHFNIPLIMQVHGGGEEEFGFLVKKASPHCDAVDMNVSCPHAKSGGYRIGYEPKLLRKVLMKARRATDKPLGVKLPFYASDQRKLEDVMKIIDECGIDFITGINTISAMDYSVELGIPVLGGKLGGQSGPSIHYCALAQVHKMRKLTEKPIIGVGGIVTAYHANQFLSKGIGANAVQLGSGLAYYDTIGSFVKEILSGLKKD